MGSDTPSIGFPICGDLWRSGSLCQQHAQPLFLVVQSNSPQHSQRFCPLQHTHVIGAAVWQPFLGCLGGRRVSLCVGQRKGHVNMLLLFQRCVCFECCSCRMQCCFGMVVSRERVQSATCRTQLACGTSVCGAVEFGSFRVVCCVCWLLGWCPLLSSSSSCLCGSRGTAGCCCGRGEAWQAHYQPHAGLAHFSFQLLLGSVALAG
jgi:hypothetical protein